MDVLKNYSEINQSIVIKEGNEIKTISALKNILSKAVVKENFPKDFAIYDLPTFIGFHSTMSEPEFEFGDESMTLKDTHGKGKYFYAEPSLVVTPPEKEIDMPDSDINFELTNDVYEDIIKKANVRTYMETGTGNITNQETAGKVVDQSVTTNPPDADADDTFTYNETTEWFEQPTITYSDDKSSDPK